MERGLRAKAGVIDDACNLTKEERDEHLKKAFDEWANQFRDDDNCDVYFDVSNFKTKGTKREMLAQSFIGEFNYIPNKYKLIQ